MLLLLLVHDNIYNIHFHFFLVNFKFQNGTSVFAGKWASIAFALSYFDVHQFLHKRFPFPTPAHAVLIPGAAMQTRGASLKTGVRRFAHTLLKRSSVESFKKCKFQAHLYHIDSESDVANCCADVLSVKRVTKSSHPHILAWRVQEAQCGFDDNGERGAGQRLLTLLENRQSESTLIVVSRWYGGSHLGPARFRAISNVAKSILP